MGEDAGKLVRRWSRAVYLRSNWGTSWPGTLVKRCKRYLQFTAFQCVRPLKNSIHNWWKAKQNKNKNITNKVNTGIQNEDRVDSIAIASVCSVRPWSTRRCKKTIHEWNSTCTMYAWLIVSHERETGSILFVLRPRGTETKIGFLWFYSVLVHLFYYFVGEVRTWTPHDHVSVARRAKV